MTERYSQSHFNDYYQKQKQVKKSARTALEDEIYYRINELERHNIASTEKSLQKLKLHEDKQKQITDTLLSQNEKLDSIKLVSEKVGNQAEDCNKLVDDIEEAGLLCGFCKFPNIFKSIKKMFTKSRTNKKVSDKKKKEAIKNTDYNNNIDQTVKYGDNLIKNGNDNENLNEKTFDEKTDTNLNEIIVSLKKLRIESDKQNQILLSQKEKIREISKINVNTDKKLDLTFEKFKKF